MCLEYLKNSQDGCKGQKSGELLEGFKQRSGQICLQRIIVVTLLKVWPAEAGEPGRRPQQYLG